MDIEYDAGKNLRNIEKHGLSFEQVIDLDWDNAIVMNDNRKGYGEHRFVALTEMNERIYSVCFTYRNGKTRIISFRKANRREQEKYRE